MYKMLNIEFKENIDEEYYKIIDKEFNKYAYACLEKGFWNGMCQWRSGGKGRFVFEVWDDDKIVAGNTKERVGCDSTSPKWDEYFEDFLDEYRL